MVAGEASVLVPLKYTNNLDHSIANYQRKHWSNNDDGK